MKRAKLNPRKLLIASVGVATIDYLVACSGQVEEPTVSIANLMPPPYAQGGYSGVANLVAPPPGYGYGGAATVANLMPAPPSVANLVAPPPVVSPPVDAGAAGSADASAAADASAPDASGSGDAG